MCNIRHKVIGSDTISASSEDRSNRSTSEYQQNSCQLSRNMQSIYLSPQRLMNDRLYKHGISAEHGASRLTALWSHVITTFPTTSNPPHRNISILWFFANLPLFIPLSTLINVLQTHRYSLSSNIPNLIMPRGLLVAVLYWKFLPARLVWLTPIQVSEQISPSQSIFARCHLKGAHFPHSQSHYPVFSF